MTFASTALIGEAFAGEGAAHTNIVLGRRGGPVETAWATALATPSAGHVPFVTVLRPSVPVQPPTLSDVIDAARAGAANPFYAPSREMLDHTEPAVAR